MLQQKQGLELQDAQKQKTSTEFEAARCAKQKAGAW